MPPHPVLISLHIQNLSYPQSLSSGHQIGVGVAALAGKCHAKKCVTAPIFYVQIRTESPANDCLNGSLACFAWLLLLTLPCPFPILCRSCKLAAVSLSRDPHISWSPAWISKTLAVFV